MEAELTAALRFPVTVDITTTGRRSGEPRRLEIWIVNIDGLIVIGGTPGRRDWFANLSADPKLIVHFKERSQVDVPAVAAEVRDAATRRRVYEHLSTRWYRDRTPVDELVALAPTVSLRSASISDQPSTRWA